MSRFGRLPPDTSRMVSVKVDGVSSRTTIGDLEYLFEKYGRIGDIYIPKEKYSKENRGFAFVRFLDKRDAEDAMDSLDGRMYDGRELRVQMAKYDRNESKRETRRGGSRSRSRSRGRRRRSRSRSKSRSRRRSRSKSKKRSRSNSRDSNEKSKSRSRSRQRSRSRSKSRDKKRSRSKSSSRSRSRSRD
eukprot:TRINITY_DN41782_c0_g1_i1.p1 TRINITY_DN41782_c0_g1~~TRINITY_DN41782_c0_g1_i1.p1  ORF type:complete len:188 (-),score=40.53 TRINITY_DN41782_c0_g1_i1:723-1286(-)